MLWLALPAFAVSPLDTDALASLTEPLAPRFSAPKEEQFRDAWLLGTRTDPRIEVVHGTLVRSKKERHTGWFAIHDASGTAILQALELDGDTSIYDVLGGSSAEVAADRNGTTWTVQLASGNAVLEVDQQESLTVQDTPWEDWVYTTTLLGFEGLPYEPMVEEPWGPASKSQERLVEKALAAVGTSEGRSALEAAIASGLPNGSEHWGGLVDAATEMGAHDLVLAAHRRWRPMGRCSMDTYPATVASQYADACFAAGRTGCALQLHVRIMDDRHDRMIWSSYGEASHPTQVAALDSTGIDVPRFLRGLVLQYDTTTTRTVGISTQRLGRAVHESVHREAMEGQLASWATDPTLDAYNRWMATMTLAWARHYQVGPTEPLLDSAGLHPLSAAWLARSEAERARQTQ